MVLGALVHLGVPQDYLEENIRGLPVEAFHLDVSTAERMSIHGRQVVVVEEGESHVSRNYRDIRKLITQSALSDPVKKQSLRAFESLAQAEAQVHHCSVDDVHFHELGGLDTIVDIVGAALGLEWLRVGKGLASEIPLGKGFVPCAHGRLPVPAPATMALLKGVPVYGTGVPYELVTPTGAAIVTTFADGFGPLPNMKIHRIGYGAGARVLEAMPNMLRIVLGETEPAIAKDHVSVIETNIDDMNPEIFGFVMEKLFEDGALDVIWLPVFMKKNRPGTMIQVICGDRDKDRLVHRLLSETTAIGVRHYRTERTKLPRKLKTVSTTLGNVQIKEVAGPEDRVSMVPEYEACKRIALEKNLPLKVVYETIAREISG